MHEILRHAGREHRGRHRRTRNGSDEAAGGFVVVGGAAALARLITHGARGFNGRTPLSRLERNNRGRRRSDDAARPGRGRQWRNRLSSGATTVPSVLVVVDVVAAVVVAIAGLLERRKD